MHNLYILYKTYTLYIIYMNKYMCKYLYTYISIYIHKLI